MVDFIRHRGRICFLLEQIAYFTSNNKYLDIGQNIGASRESTRSAFSVTH